MQLPARSPEHAGNKVGVGYSSTRNIEPGIEKGLQLHLGLHLGPLPVHHTLYLCNSTVSSPIKSNKVGEYRERNLRPFLFT